jgi:hypothetical protein
VYALTMVSRNIKTGPIPVSTSSARTCPSSCKLNGNGCYAQAGHLRLFWSKVTSGVEGMTWRDFLRAVRRIPSGRLFRHNQAGDLPGRGDRIDHDMLEALVQASRHVRGFTYTHKPMTTENARAVRKANRAGFTINLSADNLAEADRLSEIGPVVVILPAEVKSIAKSMHRAGATYVTTTPKGRKVIVCPASYRDDIQCVDCGICAAARRSAIVGFPAHGPSAKLVELATQ